MLAIIFGFFGPSFADFTFVLERYQPARIFFYTIHVSASVGASVPTGRRGADYGESPQTDNQRQTKSQKNARSLHVMNSFQFGHIQ
jgi:hypothetical protein